MSDLRDRMTRELVTKEQLLGTCLRFELEAAALYRRFQRLTRAPELEALWATMAEEEMHHAHHVDSLSTRPRLTIPAISREVLLGIVERVGAIRREAEPESALDDDKMVAITAALELSEMDDLFASVCQTADVDVYQGRADHLAPLVEIVTKREGDGTALRYLLASMVRLQRRAGLGALAADGVARDLL